MTPPGPPPRIEWKRLSRRFRTPLRTATGLYETRDSLILRTEDSAGRTGYGEVAPWPGFPVETLAEAEEQLRNADCGLRRDGAGNRNPATGESAGDDSGYASPPCFLHETPDFSTGSVIPQSAIRNPQLLPCLAAALSHARAWRDNDWGGREVALPCAGLLRDAADIPAALARCEQGYQVLKLKIARGVLSDEQRAVSALIRSLAGVGEIRIRLDANGAPDAGACAAWCDFLSEFPEIEWLEQPLPPGSEPAMRDIAERAGVAGRLALDESVCRADTLPADWPGILAVKPLLLGDLETWRARRAGFPPERLAYSSVFESPFGRQAALCIAGETTTPETPAAGFDTPGVFDDDLDIHAPGPVVRTVSREPEFWEALWNRL